MADCVGMDPLSLLRSHVAGDLSVGELHARLQAATWGEVASDPLLAEARRLIGEATSAEWSEAALREELRSLVGRVESRRELQRHLMATLMGFRPGYEDVRIFVVSEEDGAEVPLPHNFTLGPVGHLRRTEETTPA